MNTYSENNDTCMGHFQKISIKLLGHCWIINMIHWSWQTGLYKELLFSNTLQLKCKKQFDINRGKNGNLKNHAVQWSVTCIKCRAV